MTRGDRSDRKIIVDSLWSDSVADSDRKTCGESLKIWEKLFFNPRWESPQHSTSLNTWCRLWGSVITCCYTPSPSPTSPSPTSSPATPSPTSSSIPSSPSPTCSLNPLTLTLISTHPTSTSTPIAVPTPPTATPPTRHNYPRNAPHPPIVICTMDQSDWPILLCLIKHIQTHFLSQLHGFEDAWKA